MSQCGARQNEARTGPCGQDCTSHSSANLIATRCMDGESKNAETYLPLPPPTRRRVCTGVYVIHFILCGLPELGRAFLIIEQRLFALGAMRCRMRLVLYVVLTTFFRPSRARSESKPSERLWLLPWHVPPLSYRPRPPRRRAAGASRRSSARAPSRSAATWVATDVRSVLQFRRPRRATRTAPSRA
jgi:hypothetical protein